MPEIEVTGDKARSIWEWANKNGRQLVSGAIDSIGSLNIVEGDPLLIMDRGFKNIEGVAIKVFVVLTSGEVVARLVKDGVMDMPVDETLLESTREMPLEERSVIRTAFIAQEVEPEGN